MKNLKTVGRASRIAGMLFALLSAVALAAAQASAQTLTTLYTFTGGSDGAAPAAGLIADSSGNLYSTTEGGGSSTVCTGGCGIVFELVNSSRAYTEKVLPRSTAATAMGPTAACSPTRLAISMA